MEQAQSQPAINQSTAQVLVWGFRVSATLILIGLALTIARGDSLHTSLESISEMIDEAVHLEGAGIVGLGIIAMIVTPIVSTLSVVIAWFRSGDRRYGTITLAVLIILAISAALAAL